MNDVYQLNIESWDNVHSFTASILLLSPETISTATQILFSLVNCDKQLCQVISHNRSEKQMRPYQKATANSTNLLAHCKTASVMQEV